MGNSHSTKQPSPLKVRRTPPTDGGTIGPSRKAVPKQKQTNAFSTTKDIPQDNMDTGLQNTLRHEQPLSDPGRLTISKKQALWNAKQRLPKTLEEDGLNFPVLDPLPCEKCQGINLHLLQSETGYRHHENRQALVSAACSGCHICLWICEVLFPEWHILQPSIRNPGSIVTLPGSGTRKYRNAQVARAKAETADLFPYPPILKYDETSGMSRMTIFPEIPGIGTPALGLYADEGLSSFVNKQEKVTEL